MSLPTPTRRRAHTPYFLDVQNDHIDGLDTRVVSPLRTEAAFGPRARRLNPLLAVVDAPLVPDTAALGAVPSFELRQPLLRLGDGRDAVRDVPDTLLGGC